jgi:hypothetical protein
VFVEAELPVSLPFGVAKEALERAVADGGLVAASRRAVDDGLVSLMPLGPRGSHGAAGEVQVRLLPGRQVGGSVVVPMRWEVLGPDGQLSPVLDADLRLAARDADWSRLSIAGRYDPPLGRLCATVDGPGMGVASATVTALLRDLAAQLGRWATSTTSKD